MKKMLFGCCFFILCFAAGFPVIAAQEENVLQGEIVPEEIMESGERIYEESIAELMDELDFGEINDFLEGTESGAELNFKDLMQELIAKNGQVDKGWFFSQIGGILASEWQESKPIFIQILVMCVAFALLNNFAMVFQNSQIHQTCFYIFYLALITLLMKSYFISCQLLMTVMEELIAFMQALIPAFCMSLAFSAAISSAAVFYQVILAVIYLIQRILVYILIPGVHIYVVLMMLNLLTEEKMISKISSLIKKVISWSLKLMAGAITGINILQNMIAPAIDSLKNTAVTKALGAIPGIGGAADAVTNMFLGSAIVIKNGIGVTALVILLILAFAPLVKMAVLVLLYKLTGALIQPAADKSVVDCIDGVGEGVKLLLQILGTALLMFMVSVAMVTFAVR